MTKQLGDILIEAQPTDADNEFLKKFTLSSDWV